MAPWEMHLLSSLYSAIAKRLAEFAIQWNGCLLTTQSNFAKDTIRSKTWTWFISFDGVNRAMRFVLSTQFALLWESWNPDFLPWFPAPTHNAEGRLIYRGPRVAMLIHATPKLNITFASEGSQNLSEAAAQGQFFQSANSAHAYNSFDAVSPNPTGPTVQLVQTLLAKMAPFHSRGSKDQSHFSNSYGSSRVSVRDSKDRIHESRSTAVFKSTGSAGQDPEEKERIPAHRRCVLSNISNVMQACL
jgi:hypothetical protein